jgi:hypothetical protein
VGELEFGGVKGDAGDAALGGFVRAVLAVTDDRVAEGGKLYADLILQSGEQSDSHQRGFAQGAFYGIAEFGARGFAVAVGAKYLVHAFFSKIVNQDSLFCGEMAADHRQILADGRVSEKLLDQSVAIARGLGEEENS